DVELLPEQGDSLGPESHRDRRVGDEQSLPLAPDGARPGGPARRQLFECPAEVDLVADIEESIDGNAASDMHGRNIGWRWGEPGSVATCMRRQFVARSAHDPASGNRSTPRIDRRRS